jgi:hypothetical protein
MRNYENKMLWNARDMVQSRQDRMMGREFWKILHVIAVNFPDGPNDGLSQQRLKGYYDFFSSLRHVLPRSSWRDAWSHVTAGGDTELDWTSFQTLRDHRNLSRWMFAVHDKIREELKQPKSTVSYAKLYASYRKYRKGAPNVATNDTDPIGIEKLRTLLQTRAKAMDTYLITVYGPSYTSWPQRRKETARKTHVTEAASWFWSTLSNRAAKINSTFDSLDAAQRRNRVVTQFNYDYRLRHQRVSNAVYGVKGRLVNSLIS